MYNVLHSKLLNIPIFSVGHKRSDNVVFIGCDPFCSDEEVRTDSYCGNLHTVSVRRHLKNTDPVKDLCLNLLKANNNVPFQFEIAPVADGTLLNELSGREIPVIVTIGILRIINTTTTGYMIPINS